MPVAAARVLEDPEALPAGPGAGSAIADLVTIAAPQALRPDRGGVREELSSSSAEIEPAPARDAP
jgi:hypothetical protein